MCARDSTDEAAQSPRKNKYPSLEWLTESWLGRVVSYERIATASPKLGVGIIGQSLLDHHINLLPHLHSLADFVSVRNDGGEHVGYRAKVRTWPLLERETIETREFAA